MDLRQKAVSDTAFLHLRDADDELLYEKKKIPDPENSGGTIEVDDEEKPVGIWLYGPGSKQFAKATAAKNNRNIDRLKKKGKSDMSAQEAIEDGATFLAGVTKSFQYIERDGLEGEALFKAVYADITHGFISDQVTAFIGEWGNFKQGSTKP
jgi:hypothetical protein